MLLKKQTVWLLTMLSLVVVLSVYYITTPEGSNEDFAFVEQNEGEVTEGVDVTTTGNSAQGEGTVEETGDNSIISSVSSDELFTALRLGIQDQRSQLKEDLEAIVTSSEVSAEEKSEALDQMQQLSKIQETELTLETLIKARGYEDALVRADGKKVIITVKAESPSSSEAVEIIQLVRNEFPNMESAANVAVEFQPGK